MRKLTLALALTVGWALACGGASSDAGPTEPDEPEQPEPEPEPRPEPAPNADKCRNYQGVSIPLDEGVITACTDAAVTIEHAQGDPKALRWDYRQKYVDGGWSQIDLVNNNPAVSQGSKTLVFENSSDAVILRCTGCTGGGGGGGDRPGRPGRPRPRPGR